MKYLNIRQKLYSKPRDVIKQMVDVDEKNIFV